MTIAQGFSLGLPSSNGFRPGGTAEGVEQLISPAPPAEIAPEFPKGIASRPIASPRLCVKGIGLLRQAVDYTMIAGLGDPLAKVNHQTQFQPR
jgi:hypothetical protein